jgi:hypothetical protein
MGNTNSSQSIKKSSIKFGSINDKEHSRPGYYANGKIIKYHTDKILLLPEENIESFKKLKYGYAITNKRVFYKGTPLKNVNPLNFKVFTRENINSLGKNNLTKLNSVLGIENDKNVYHKGKLIDTIV